MIGFVLNIEMNDVSVVDYSLFGGIYLVGCKDVLYDYNDCKEWIIFFKDCV